MGKLLSICLVLIGLGTIGLFGYRIYANDEVTDKFTEFYILNENGEAGNYPKTGIVGGTYRLTVGIVNREQQPEAYRIEIVAGGENISDSQSVWLESNERWEEVRAFAPIVVGYEQKVEILLYKQGQSKVCENLYILMDIIENKGGKQ